MQYFQILFFRSEQYLISTKFLDKPPKVLPHSCPQSDFSIKNDHFLKLRKLTKKIGVVDNHFSDDCFINYRDINSLIIFLISNKHKLEFILQSKRGYLESELRRLNQEEKNFISCKKGDFSNLKYADLIISIGWQSIALKAATAYNKPLLFYSVNDYPYKNHFFSFNENKNKIINNYCKSLWISEFELSHKFENFFQIEIIMNL